MGKLDSAFWHDDFGFLIDRSHLPLRAVEALSGFRDDKFADFLEISGRLPNLNGALVASWLLPRLAEVTLGGINLDDQERVHNDGGCVSLNWISFTKELKPRAFFNLLCFPNRIVIQGKCMPNTTPGDLASAFVSPLFEHPKALQVEATRHGYRPTERSWKTRAYVCVWMGRGQIPRNSGIRVMLRKPSRPNRYFRQNPSLRLDWIQDLRRKR